jgi:hypothetical protein
MDRQLRSWIIAGIAFSILTNLVLVTAVIVLRPVQVAVGQTAEGGNTMMLGTEKIAESPVCFILDPGAKHLAVYKVDTAGCLQLTSSRDIGFDLKLSDSHFPNGQAQGPKTTLPKAKDVQSAISRSEKKASKDKEE